MRHAAVAVALAVGLAVSGCGDWDGSPQGDELSDFNSTTTEPAADPYFDYLGLAERAGRDPLPAAEAAERSAVLCFDELTAAEAVADDPTSTDALLVLAYCPDLAAP